MMFSISTTELGRYDGGMPEMTENEESSIGVASIRLTEAFVMSDPKILGQNL
jgi:hypothetical protein